jgi:hypothetical protein
LEDALGGGGDVIAARSGLADVGIDVSLLLSQAEERGA